MCTTLFAPGGREITTKADLIDLLKLEIPDRPMRIIGDPAGCLCDVNLRTITVLAGWKLEWKGEDAIATRRCDA